MQRSIGFIFIALLACSAFAQQYPSKPIRLVVGFAAGGPSDGGARTMRRGFGAWSSLRVL